MSDSCNTLDCNPPGSSVHGIFQQEYWSGLPFPSPGDLPDPGINLGLPHFRQTLYCLSHHLDSTFKRRDISLPTKVHLVKAMVFPVVIYVCESWTIKKAEFFYAFELWHCRRLLRVPWTARRSNQSILREISPEYSLEGLTLKLLWPPDAK